MLFSTIDEMRAFVDIPRAIKFDKLRAAILVAENNYLKEALSPEMYVAIETAYQASIQSQTPVSMTADQLTLWEKIAFPLAQLSIMEAADSLNVSFSDGGFTRSETENNKSAYEYQVNRFKASLMKSGFDGLDWLISYLEANADTFATYRDSPTRLKESNFSSIQFLILRNI